MILPRTPRHCCSIWNIKGFKTREKQQKLSASPSFPKGSKSVLSLGKTVCLGLLLKQVNILPRWLRPKARARGKRYEMMIMSRRKSFKHSLSHILIVKLSFRPFDEHEVLSVLFFLHHKLLRDNAAFKAQSSRKFSTRVWWWKKAKRTFAVCNLFLSTHVLSWYKTAIRDAGGTRRKRFLCRGNSIERAVQTKTLYIESPLSGFAFSIESDAERFYIFSFFL